MLIVLEDELPKAFLPYCMMCQAIAKHHPRAYEELLNARDRVLLLYLGQQSPLFHSIFLTSYRFRDLTVESSATNSSETGKDDG
jgi:hypothetical protein